jgi:2-oxoglutarate ferredoxin oxidoreductase subunit alpha
MPVIHMLDKAIANSVITSKTLDPIKVRIDRVSTVAKISEADKGAAGNYLRFKLTDNPISPRVVLGTEGAIFWNTGDEHTEEGHITEDPELRVNMMEKRMNKLGVALKEIPDDDKAVAYGAGDIAIISWGSTKGVILDTLEKLKEEGIGNVKFVQVRLMHPFPSDLMNKMLAGSKKLIGIEMNYSAQLGMLLRQNTGRDYDYKIVKYNGRPMSLEEVYNAVKRIIDEDDRAPRRQVLRHGA